MKKEWNYAFLQTIPVLCGYLFLGTAFGLLMNQAGFGVLWAFLTSVFVYAGSMQFALVGLLSSGTALVSIALLTLSINCRHIFYGFSFLEKFKSMGRAYPYMVFSLTDETYSLLCSAKIPKELDENRVTFYISFLDQLYWVAGSVIGSLLGQLLPFQTTGLDFAMTALFVVIFVEQWLSAKSHLPALVGLGCGIVSLILLGPDQFILPALAASVLLLLLLKGTLSKNPEVLA